MDSAAQIITALAALVAAIGAVIAAIGAARTIRKVDATHELVNSRMTALLNRVRKSSIAKGLRQGRSEKKRR